MPYDLYRSISDADVRAMVGYLRTVPAVKNQLPRSRYTVPLPASYGPAVTRVGPPPQNDLVKYGAYLAGPIAHCVECHTPHDTTMRPDRSRWLAGGFRFEGPFGVSYSTNLTPDPETGIGRWTDAQIVAGVNGTDPSGRVVMPPMPWPYYAGKIAPRDLQAIIAYLRSAKPVKNAVRPPEPAKPPAR
jgi:mono/diheme cytochrome c family protein